MHLSKQLRQFSLGRLDLLRGPVTPVLTASVPFVLALALFLAARRAIGALTGPLELLLLLSTAVPLLAWALAVRGVCRSPTSRPANSLRGTRAWLIHWTPVVVLVLVAFACSYPGSRLVDWLVWLSVAAAVWWESFTARAPWNTALRAPSTKTTSDAASSKLGVEDLPSPARGLPVPASEDRIVQQLTRRRAADGRDLIQGTLLAEFAPGQRHATLYAAFCPPFECLPRVEAAPEDASLATVRLTQVLHNGTQLEVRLSRPADDAQAVTVYLQAFEPPND